MALPDDRPWYQTTAAYLRTRHRVQWAQWPGNGRTRGEALDVTSGPTRTLIDSYEPALNTEINRTSGTLNLTQGDLILIVGLFVGGTGTVDFTITFTHTFTGVTFTEVKQVGSDGTRKADVIFEWAKITADVSGTYTFNLPETGERLGQVYCYRYTGAGTVRAYDSDGGDIAAGGHFDLTLSQPPLAASECMIGVAYRPKSPFTNRYVVQQDGWTVINDHTTDDNASGRVFVASGGMVGAVNTLAFNLGSGDEFDHAAFVLEVTYGSDVIALGPATQPIRAQPVTIATAAATMNLVAAARPIQARPVTITAVNPPVTLVKATVTTTARPVATRLDVPDLRPWMPPTATYQRYRGKPQQGWRQVFAPVAQVINIVRAVVVSSARPTTNAQAITLGRASRPVQARPLTLTEGPISMTLGRRSCPLTARPVTLTPGASTRAAAAGTVHAGARPLTTTVGAVTRTLGRATLVARAQPLTNVKGTVTVALVKKALTCTARPVTITVGPAPTITLNRKVLSFAARPLTTTQGAVSLTLARRSVAAVARPVVTTGSVTLALGRRSCPVQARPVTVSRGTVTVALNHATVHAGARPEALVAGTRTVTLGRALLHASTGSVDPDLIDWALTAVGASSILPE